jgi:hypothetical protein
MNVSFWGDHLHFISGLVVYPKEDQEIPSVSDDRACGIWSLEGRQTVHFVLHFPGMNVCGHLEDVTEKNRPIQFFYLLVQQNNRLFCLLKQNRYHSFQILVLNKHLPSCSCCWK